MNKSSIPRDTLRNKTSPAEPAAARGELHVMIHTMSNFPSRHLFHVGFTEVGFTVFPLTILFETRSP